MLRYSVACHANSNEKSKSRAFAFFFIWRDCKMENMMTVDGSWSCNQITAAWWKCTTNRVVPSEFILHDELPQMHFGRTPECRARCVALLWVARVCVVTIFKIFRLKNHRTHTHTRTKLKRWPHHHRSRFAFFSRNVERTTNRSTDIQRMRLTNLSLVYFPIILDHVTELRYGMAAWVRAHFAWEKINQRSTLEAFIFYSFWIFLLLLFSAVVCSFVRANIRFHMERNLSQWLAGRDGRQRFCLNKEMLRSSVCFNANTNMAEGVSH